MTFPQVYRLFNYWKTSPPIHEIGALMARVFTTWKPVEDNADPPEIAHRKSLEARWAAGYMNVADMFKAGGGTLEGARFEVVEESAEALQTALSAAH